jgi:diacylglycerol kinase (ATP)
MKALLLYSHTSGHKDFSSQIAYVKKHLEPLFDALTIVCTLSKEEAGRLEEEACDGGYDVLIIVGGDGTFNNAVNHLMAHAVRPILGYLNFGTIGDVGRNFGITSSFKKAVELIERGHIESFDVGDINGRYFAYTCAIGRYSDIAYITTRQKKRSAGRSAYYAEATKQAFQPKIVNYRVEANGISYAGSTPFLMVLNGRYMGGFSVNSHGKIDDGKMELFLTAPGAFNGLGHYLLHSKVQIISASSFVIEHSEDTPWCLDGEKGPSGRAIVTTHPAALRIFSKKLAKTPSFSKNPANLD